MAPQGDRVVYWLCVCDCGRTPPHEVRGKSLTGKAKTITMCAACSEDLRLASVTSHGETNSRLYHIWKGMRSRAGVTWTKPTDAPHYVDKGIRMFHEWVKSYEVFKKWALDNGYDDSLTIDRIDNNKGYFPNNCRWTSRAKQNQNLTTNVIITWNVITGCAALIWDKAQSPVSYGCFTRRLREGWTVEDALFTLTPRQRRNRGLAS